MPEGHIIHALAQQMSELVGQPVGAASLQGRFPAEAIDGHPLVATEAYGKNLILDSATGLSVHVHLGMRGKWLRFSPVTGPGLPQVRLRLVGSEVAWDLIAPSRCALLDSDQRSALINSLGPDPLRPEANPDEAYRRVRSFAGPIGAALLDQSRIAGVGNVFRAEALHACGIAPTQPARSLSRDQFGAIWVTLRHMMATAVSDGRIITVVADDRRAVPEDRARRVYKQVTCYDCGATVHEQQVGGRTSYSCPICQPA